MRLRSVALLLALAAALGATAPAQTPASFSTAPRLTGYLQPRFQALGDTASFFLRRARFAVVNGEGPNRASNPDNRMAYFARAVVTPVKGLDVGGAFEGYSDSAAVNAQGIYRAVRWTARAEYIDEHNRRTGTHTKGWYALAGYDVLPQRVELVGRVEQFDPSDRVASDRSTGYLLGLQYFVRGDAFKMMADYELFREQAIQVKNDRAVVQMQVRW